MPGGYYYEPNVAPNVPGSLLPAGQTVQGALTFSGTFSDPNTTVDSRANVDEKLTQYQVQVRNPADASGALIANVLLDATSQEQTNAAFSWAYDGAALSSGVPYEWRCRVADAFGAWSSWSDEGASWTAFTVGPGGSLTIDPARFPSGTDPATGFLRTERTIRPVAIPVTWTHPTNLALTAYRIQFRQNGSVVRDATITGQNVASGAVLSMLPTISAWTAASLASLSRGVTYTVWAAGQDSAGTFFGLKQLATVTINAAPLTPTDQSPGSGLFGSLPVLSFRMADPDDAASTGLVAVIGLTTATNSNLRTGLTTKRAPVNGVANDYWDYATTLNDLKAVQANSTGYGDFRWYAFGQDAVGAGASSGTKPFTYALVPAPIVTAPTANQVVTNTPFSFTWTVVDQASRRLVIYKAGTNTAVYDSGTATTATTSQSVGLGGFPNNADYEATVTVTNSQANSGTSPRRPFRLQYAPAAALTNVQAQGYVVGNDAAATSIQVTWEPSTLGSEFGGYTLQKHRIDAPFASDWVTIYTSQSVSANRYLDVYPWTGAQYEYRAWQTRVVGITRIQGVVVVTPPIEIAFTGVLLTDARNVFGDRALIPFTTDRETDYIRDRTTLDVWDDGPPALAESGQENRVIRFTAKLVQESLDDDSVEVQLNRIRRLAGFRSDRSPMVILYRDGSGRAAMMRLMVRNDRQITPYYLEAECELTEVASDVTPDGAVRALIGAAESLVDLG